MEKLLNFNVMFTPIIIRVIYFLGLLAVAITAIAVIFKGNFLAGLGILLFGLIGVRIYCELMILFFRVYETLQSINQKLDEQNSASGRA